MVEERRMGACRTLGIVYCTREQLVAELAETRAKEEQARAELKRFAGTQVDPTVVGAFLKVLDSPRRHEWTDDELTECGVLPGYGRRIMED
jgi:hypothetical protein